MVVDLAGISHLGTVQLDRLRLMRRRLARGGGRLRLAAPGEALWTVILGAGADAEFLWSEDVVGALVEMGVGVPLRGGEAERDEATSGRVG